MLKMAKGCFCLATVLICLCVGTAGRMVTDGKMRGSCSGLTQAQGVCQRCCICIGLQHCLCVAHTTLLHLLLSWLLKHTSGNNSSGSIPDPTCTRFLAAASGTGRAAQHTCVTHPVTLAAFRLCAITCSIEIVMFSPDVTVQLLQTARPVQQQSLATPSCSASKSRVQSL